MNDTIERKTIDGREATISYFDENFDLVNSGEATLVKVQFNDGEVIFLTPQPKEMPEAKFGNKEEVNWRKAEGQDDKDDDEELAKTPEDVVEMLGFDPLEEKQEATLDAIADSVDRMVKQSFRLGERFK